MSLTFTFAETGWQDDDPRESRLPPRLFLDDSRTAPEGWVPCRTPEDFRYLVSRYTWDDISFDYCLSEFSDDSETGYDLLRWMFAQGYRPAHKPNVHTSLPSKHQLMTEYINSVWEA